MKNSLSLLGGIALCGALLASGVTKEVPTGTVEGKITFQESGKPFAKASLTFIPKFSGTGYESRVRVVECDKDGRFALRNVASGEYEVNVSARAHEVPMTRYHVGEGKTEELNLALVPTAPYLDLYSEQKVFTPAEAPELKVEGFNQAKDLNLTLYKVNTDQVLSAGGLYNTLSPLNNTNYKKGSDPIKVGAKISSQTHKIKNRDAEGVFIEYLKLEKMEPGVYWLNCEGGGILRGTPFIVSEIAMITKRSDGDVRYFVADILTGKPIAGAQVGFSNGPAKKDIGKSKTDGTFNGILPGDSRGKNLVLYATKGKSIALVDFERENQETGSGMVFSIYTDRPIYRPGDEFHFKSIVRKMAGARYALPAPSLATIEFYDPEDGLLERKTAALSSHGTLNGSFSFNKEAAPGDYYVKVIVGGQEQTRYVTCASYRKPLYNITVTPERSSYVRGERARFVVKAEYYYGGPVAGAKVQASILRETYWDTSMYGEDFEEDSEWYGGSGGEYLEDIETTTDSNGKAVVEIDTIRKNDAKELEFDYVYNVSASVTDESGQYFDGQGTVRVFRGAVATSMEVGSYSAKPDQPVEVKVQVKNRDNGTPIAGQEVTVKTAYEFYTNNTIRELPSDTVTGTTGPDGVATISIKSNLVGSLRIRAMIRDGSGNEIVESSWIWIDGFATAESRPLVDLAVKLDKPQYKAGDIAHAVILSNSPGGSALVTIEGERVYEQQVVSLDSPSATLDFVVKDEYAPNVEIVVSLIHDKKVNASSSPIKVDLGQRKLQVSVKSDQDSYLPGGTAKYTIETKRQDGTPTSAEVSLGVVDESIYALAPDRTDPLKTFYPRRNNQVQTLDSIPELYLDGGDKAPSSIQVRRIFKDTAFWNPTIQTDAQGTATVEVRLPDNLTTWRATAVAATDQTEVGMAISKALAKKPLMIRLEGPSGMVVGDQQRLVGFVTNETGQTQQVKIQLDGTGIKLEGQMNRTITVADGKTESVDWQMDSPESGEAILVGKAWTDSGANDGVELKFPIRPVGRLEIESSAGEFTDQVLLNVNLRPGADKKYGRLRLTISPSLASVLVQSLNDLIDYPYGCVEQTMSRFMPAVVVRKTFADLQLPPNPRNAEIPLMVADGYVRLKRMQHSSGMWGWWEYDEDNAGMTAYVLEGMHHAAKAGFPPNKNVVNRALEGVEKYLKTVWKEPTMPEGTIDKVAWQKGVDYERMREIASRAYLAYALSLHGRNAAPYLKALDLSKGGVTAYAFASLATKGGTEEILKRANKAGNLLHWQEEWDGVETTARCFQALWAAGEGRDQAPSVLRYLMLKRRGQSWMSTKDTSIAVLALAGYLASSQELTGDGKLDIQLNGAPFGSIPISREGLVNPNFVIDIPVAQLKEGANAIHITKTDKALAYYSHELKQYVEGGDFTSAGVNLTRSYHLLETQPLEDGTLRFLPNAKPETSFRRGDLVRGKIELIVTTPQEFVLIEEPTPSGFRVIEREDPGLYEEWTWWFSRLQVYDDRVAVFATHLPIGTHTIEYTMRAENPGKSTAPPTLGYPMYNPDVRFFGAASKVEIR